MTVLPVLGVATLGALAVVALGRWRTLSLAVAAVAVVALAALLPAAGAGAPLIIDGAGSQPLALAGSPFLRSLVGVGLAGGILLLAIGVLQGGAPDGRSRPAATAATALAATAGIALAIGMSSAPAGVLALTGTTAVASVLALAGAPAPVRFLAVAREARGSATALTGGLLAMTVSGAAVVVQPALSGLILLGAAAVLGHRVGAIPLHARVSRLADAAPLGAFPVLAAWIPAAWAAILVAWAPVGLAGSGSALGLERGLVVLVGLATLSLGTVAAMIQDQVEHVVAYTIVQDVGVILLALGSLDGSMVVAFHAWLVAFVAVRMALAGWTLAFRATFGTTRLRETRGWARRAPTLAVALAVTGAASIGWPGLLAWDARIRVLQAATAGPLFLLAFAGSLGTVAAACRILWVGAGKPAARVIAAPAETPRIPADATDGAAGQPPTVGRAQSPARPGAPAGLPGAGATLAAGRASAGTFLRTAAVGARRVGPILAANLAPLRALVAIILAGIALLAAANGLGVPRGT